MLIEIAKTMKKKILGLVFIIFIYAFPFRYAVLSPTGSNTFNLLCMIATVLGTLIFMAVAMSDGEEHQNVEKHH
jgi:hypothetical protein